MVSDSPAWLANLKLMLAVCILAADRDGTVYFSAPLYRKNLHYVVQPKPASANAAIQVMADYIMTKHAGDSGIVYCLSKKVSCDVFMLVDDACAVDEIRSSYVTTSPRPIAVAFVHFDFLLCHGDMTFSLITRIFRQC